MDLGKGQNLSFGGKKQNNRGYKVFIFLCRLPHAGFTQLSDTLLRSTLHFSELR